MTEPLPTKATMLQYGIVEHKAFKWPKSSDDIYGYDGRYGDALRSLDELFDSRAGIEACRTYWERAQSYETRPAHNEIDATSLLKSRLRYQLIGEAEIARKWREGPLDHLSARRDYNARATKDAIKIKSAIDLIRHMDGRHAYLLRQSFAQALERHLCSREVIDVDAADPNTMHGYQTIRVSGPDVQDAQFRFANRMALFEFSNLLDGWVIEIDKVFRDWPLHWREFGGLLLERPLTHREAAKINVSQLGLVAAMLTRLRDFTAGRGFTVLTYGQAIPRDGKPCWNVIGEFVSASLSPNRPVDGETIRRVWQKFDRRHRPCVGNWPKPAVAQPQEVRK